MGDEDTQVVGGRTAPWHFAALALVQAAYGIWTCPEMYPATHDPGLEGRFAVLLVGLAGLAVVLTVPIVFGRAWAVLLSALAALGTVAVLLVWVDYEDGRLHGGELLLYGWAVVALLHAVLLMLSFVAARAARAGIPPR